MFTTHTRRFPDYLTNSMQACNSDPARIRLRSASNYFSDKNEIWQQSKQRNSVAGPVVWNSLPAAVCEADSLYLFKRKLKTHLFTLF